MDRNNTIASTVSIRDSRFSAVDGAALTRRPGTRVIDLQGRTAVPGIIDNHNHIVLLGNRPGYHVPLENASSIADVQEIVSAQTEEIPPTAWITTIGGFHRNQFFPPGQNPRLPTRAELDAAAASNPDRVTVDDLNLPGWLAGDCYQTSKENLCACGRGLWSCWGCWRAATAVRLQEPHHSTT